MRKLDVLFTIMWRSKEAQTTAEFYMEEQMLRHIQTALLPEQQRDLTFTISQVPYRSDVLVEYFN